LNAGVFIVRGPITPLDIPGLCDRLRLLLICADTDAIACDVGGLIDADGAAVDALARLQLIAGRFGTQLLLCGASSELQELLALAGLDEIVGSAG
jgi:ABC-type transporter Mla MlaB component